LNNARLIYIEGKKKRTTKEVIELIKNLCDYEGIVSIYRRIIKN